jgi:hypothetical protein
LVGAALGLLGALVTDAPPHNRDVEAAKRHALSKECFGGGWICLMKPEFHQFDCVPGGPPFRL